MSAVSKILYTVFLLLGDSPSSQVVLTPPVKMEHTEFSETSEHKIQTPGNYPKEIIQHSEYGKSLKPRKVLYS
jgi:hypothetical protein